MPSSIIYLKSPMISLIVPVLDDAAALKGLMQALPADARVQIIAVDGGHDSALESIVASRPDLRLLRTSPGRGHQMNVGAAAAGGTWFLFLHADSRLPTGWIEEVCARDATIVGEWFRFQLDSGAWQVRVIERLVALRVRVFHLPYGDQAIFVRRSVFTAMGGYRELPLMEDVEFVRRLKRMGRLRSSPLLATTSARRWERDSWFRGSVRNLTLLGLYVLGVSPRRLVEWY